MGLIGVRLTTMFPLHTIFCCNFLCVTRSLIRYMKLHLSRASCSVPLVKGQKARSISQATGESAIFRGTITYLRLFLGSKELPETWNTLISIDFVGTALRIHVHYYQIK